jgi:hypothetical protein
MSIMTAERGCSFSLASLKKNNHLIEKHEEYTGGKQTNDRILQAVEHGDWLLVMSDPHSPKGDV